MALEGKAAGTLDFLRDQTLVYSMSFQHFRRCFFLLCVVKSSIRVVGR